MTNKNLSVSELFTQCFLRDNHTCQDCGATEIHHILPISQGGKNEIKNLKTVCYDCHQNNYKDVHYPKDKSKLVPYEQREKIRYGIDKSRYSQISFSLSPELLKDVIKHQLQKQKRSHKRYSQKSYRSSQQKELAG